MFWRAEDLKELADRDELIQVYNPPVGKLIIPGAATSKSQTFEPVYLRTYARGELAGRVEGALELLQSCTACPRNCRVNRLEDKFGVCKTGRHAVVSSHFPHHGANFFTRERLAYTTRVGSNNIALQLLQLFRRYANIGQ